MRWCSNGHRSSVGRLDLTHVNTLQISVYMTRFNSQAFTPQAQTALDSMSLSQAHQVLKQFDCALSSTSSSSSVSQQEVQTALQVVAQHSEFQILGICADSTTEGILALRAYANALGYTLSDLPDSLQTVQGPVYIKFNPKAQLLYADGYSGQHRGVLVSCQSAYDDGLNDMYGHLPLTLFEQSPDSELY